MTAFFVPSPPFNQPIEDGSGQLSRVWYAWFMAVYNRLGGAIDKVDAAYAAALSAAPASTLVVAAGGLRTVGGPLSGNVGIVLYRTADKVAALPTAGNSDGDWAYAVDGRKPGEGVAAGTGVPVWWSHGAWIAVTSGMAVIA